MKTNSTLILVISLTLFSYSSFAQWQSLNGPFGVETSSAVFFDSLSFAATASGLTVSLDSSQNWTIDSVGINGTTGQLIFKEGKLIYDRYFNTNGGSISLDSGKTWIAMNTIGPFPPIKYDLSFDTIYVWCEYGSLYYSANNGSSWTAMAVPPTTNNVTDMVANNGRLYVMRSAFGTGQGGIYYSDNLGTSWQSLSTNGITGTSIQPYQLLVNGNQLFLVCNSDLYKSIDGGNTWTLFNTGLPTNYCCYTHFTRISISKNKIYASVSNGTGLLQSDTAVAAFTNISNGLPFETDVNSISENQNYLFASAFSGLFRTNKNSINWQLSQTGIQSISFNAVETRDSNLFIGTYNGFQVSHNNGDSYSAIPSGKSTTNFYFDNNDVYACSARGYKSADYGYTWTDINFPYGFYSQSLTDFCIVNGTFFGINIDQSIKYSTNNGVTWNGVNGIPASTALCIAANNGIVFVGTSNGIYYSSNLGSTWSVALTGIFLRKIKIENGNVFALSSGALYVSYNNGSTWNNLNCPATYLNSFAVKNNTIIVSPGLFYTHNFGTSWDSIIAPVVPFQSAPTTLCMNNDYLFAGFYSSVFRLPLSVITNTIAVTINQNTLEISPNPAKDILQIHFTHNNFTNEKTAIKIFDAMGRIVFENLISSSIKENVEINISSLSKGIYFMQATAHGEQLARKFVKD